MLWVNVCRLILGAAFLFSGFTKSVDPTGFYYKLQDYIKAFGMAQWMLEENFLYLPNLLLCMAELSVGAFLLFGIRRKLSSTVALLLMVVMTPLTLYLALANPVSDCGCFGDAWVLTNWQTFGKNIVLLIAAVSVFKWKQDIFRLVTEKMEWMVSTYTYLFAFILWTWCLSSLPILDFRPFKIGTNIKESMEVPPGAKLSVLETTFILEKDGRREEFTMDNYPDSTWTFIESRTREIEPGYEPPIKSFDLSLLETGEDITDSILNDSTYTFLLVMWNTQKADDEYIDLINEVYDYSVEHGYGFYALTASGEQDVEKWCDMTGAEYSFCTMDEITLKTIVRANPGLVLLKDGVIYNKWAEADVPDEYQLTGPLEDIPLGQMKKVDDLKTLGYVLLWYIIPLMLVIIVDVSWVRPRQRRRRKLAIEAQRSAQQQQETSNT